MRFLMGVETEYAAHGVDAAGRPADRQPLVQALVRVAAADIPWLPDPSGAGVFLPNGGRLYCDVGFHPEFAAPECEDPRTLVRYVRAGERLLARAAERVPRREPGIAHATVFRCNVDYWTGSAWGCHESYRCGCDPRLLAKDLIPHVVSRIVYGGAGGFDPTYRGLLFVLSPRACLATEVISTGSVRCHPLFHVRDEPLAGPGHRRVHVTLGDTPCSDLALALRAGATALVLGAIERGHGPGDAVALQDPLAALRTFNTDPACRARVPLRNGRRATAVEIQRSYLEVAERLAGEDGAPPWAAVLCSWWRETLDALERDPRSLAGRLDWPLKREIYRAWREREGAARWRLLEADVRFGQLGSDGVFARLDREGLLDHRLAAEEEVERALREPPPGRARIRGRWVELLGRGTRRHVADWTAIREAAGDRWLDLTDPFGEEAVWRGPSACPGGDDEAGG